VPDSSTGGYLPPQPPLPLNDSDLQHFFHGVIVGVTALPDTLVRPAWQQNPPPIPAIDINWMAFSITIQAQDNEPAQVQISDSVSEMRRHENLDILCTFYGPDAQSISMSFRDGIYLGQNREPLLLAGMGLVGFDDIQHVPELINDRYFNRCDLNMLLRREVKRQFPILTFLKAEGTFFADDNAKIIERNFSSN
jgi:hypothetical protein